MDNTLFLAIKKVIAQDELAQFYKKNGIDSEDMHYLGKGEFGVAYAVGNGKVLKITSSKNEYGFAKEIQNGNFPGFAKIFDTAEINRDYYIVLEKLKQPSNIEDMFFRVRDMLDTQGLPISYVGHFDMDEYLDAQGDEVVDGVIAPEVLKFMGELEDIIRCYHRLGIEAMDIQPGEPSPA